MPEWDGLLPPVSCGERPIIDGVRTPVAYSSSERYFMDKPLLTDACSNASDAEIIVITCIWGLYHDNFEFCISCRLYFEVALCGFACKLL